jgi:cell fate (sporulation/competence/biofilm development) regulator YlbF (YheA/YmcA/DUF963 family)
VDDILEIAEKLASSIRSNPRFKNLREAEKAVDADEPTRRLLAEYNEITLAIIRKEEEMKPIEPAEKRKLVDLKEKVVANNLLQGLSRAQADFSEMMNKVNRTLQARLGNREDGHSSAPPK